MFLDKSPLESSQNDLEGLFFNYASFSNERESYRAYNNYENVCESPIEVKNNILNIVYLIEIYATLGENEFLQTRPSTLHFQGFEAGKRYSQKLVDTVMII